MCGIAGLFSNNGSVDVDSLSSMNECLAHRGPDDSGVYVDAPVGIAHRRLSIIDPRFGQQPMFNEDDTVITVFNGEIYNYKQLRENLSKSGHTFTTKCDTEVLVHLYEEHGPSFVSRLEGMFSFAVWDTDKQRLLLARDPMGIKPLFLAESNDGFAFASELPAILASSFPQGDLNEAALSEYFALGFIPAPHTAFQNVSKLQPGELAVISADGVNRHKFYNIEINTTDPGFEAAAAKLRSRLRKSVKDRLQSDVPLGAFLSGGIDSSIIVGTMVELLDNPVKTFTVSFDESVFDEGRAAREVANYHGTDHHEFSVSAEDVKNLIPEVIARLGEPFGDQSLLPTYVVAQETSENVKVALSGDGADELFAGYDRYRAEYQSQYYRTFPSSIQTGIKTVVNTLPASRASRTGEIIKKSQEFVNGASVPSLPDRHFTWRRIPGESALNAYQEINPVQVGKSAYRKQHKEFEDSVSGGTNRFVRIQAVDTRFPLPNKILQKVDLASMFNSLEVRVPMLDTSIVEHALSLPTEYKITPRKRKRILKYAFKDVIPQEILNRNKQGFDMPIGEWFKHELRDEFKSAVRMTDSGLLNEQAILSVLDDHVSGNQNHWRFLWNVYVFKSWLRRMEKEGYI